MLERIKNYIKIEVSPKDKIGQLVAKEINIFPMMIANLRFKIVRKQKEWPQCLQKELEDILHKIEH